jgi:hypothetical protein
MSGLSNDDNWSFLMDDIDLVFKHVHGGIVMASCVKPLSRDSGDEIQYYCWGTKLRGRMQVGLLWKLISSGGPSDQFCGHVGVLK